MSTYAGESRRVAMTKQDQAIWSAEGEDPIAEATARPENCVGFLLSVPSTQSPRRHG